MAVFVALASGVAVAPGKKLDSRKKGGRGEREFAALCRDEGYTAAKRGQQYQGGADSPDVKGLPGIHVEVKRVERLNIHEAMKQAARDSSGCAIPIVAHRRNRDNWLVTMSATDWFSMYREWESGRYLENRKEDK